jgi:hypothetical protein
MGSIFDRDEPDPEWVLQDFADKPQVGQYLFDEGHSVRIVEVYEQHGFGWYVRGESGLRYYIVTKDHAWHSLKTLTHP